MSLDPSTSGLVHWDVLAAAAAAALSPCPGGGGAPHHWWLQWLKLPLRE